MRKALSVLASCALVSLAEAQTSNPGATTTGSPAPTPYIAVARDGFSTVWQRQTYDPGPNDTIVTNTHSYVECATSLNHLVNGQYVPSSDQIVISPDGTSAEATNAAHCVFFPGNIYNGLIKLVTPGGEVVQSQPLSLSYSDGTNSVLLGVLTNSIGAILPSGAMLIYSNAFAGLDADLLYSDSIAGMAQDIVLRASPPDPASFGMIPANTRLQVVTEFSTSSQPSVTPTTMMTPIGNLEDDSIAFGTMQMIRGKAFLLGTNSPPVGVAKRWLTVNGRQFLVEEVPYLSIAQALNSLPPFVAGRSRGSEAQKLATRLGIAGSGNRPSAVNQGLLTPAPTVSEKLVLPPYVAGKSRSNEAYFASRNRHGSGARGLLTPAPAVSKTRFLAKAAPPRRGLVLDYMVFNGSQTNYVFQGDTTYEITNAVYVFSRTFTFEGGSVLKFTRGASLNFIGAGGTYPHINWLGSAYHPVVFTAVDDNSVGQPIGSGNPGNNRYANPALMIVGIPNYSIDGLRIAYAQAGLMLSGYGGTVADAQFVNCWQGIWAQDTALAPIWVENALFANVQTNFSSLAEVSIQAQNSTFANSTYLETGQTEYYTNYASVSLTNCILANVATLSGSYYDTISADHNGFYPNWTYGSSAISCSVNPFQTAGGGNYYLNTNQNGGGALMGAGTAGIDPVLWTNLQSKTTRPPNTNYIGHTISSDTFTTLVARDSESPGPDIGYHYDSLDFIFQKSTNSSLTMTFPAGAAIGWQGQGLTNTGNSDSYRINFNGTVASNDYFVRCNTVQESDQSGDGTGIAGSGLAPTVNATFTRFSALGDYAAFFDANIWEANVYNGEFWDGMLGNNGAAGLFLHCTNCLFDRSILDFPPNQDGNYFISLNCTLHGGSLTLNNADNDTYAHVTNSAFDGTVITVTGLTNGYFFCSTNAYLTNATKLPNDTTDVAVTNFNWQSGPRGRFYLPHDPPAQDGTKLIDAGDQPATKVFVTVDGSWGAAEPLSTFTTQTNQTADTNIVDIGYHYPIRFPEPPVLVSGNNYPNSVGIQTYEFASGILVTNFIPQSASKNYGAYVSAYGRGLAIYNATIYYTEFLYDSASQLSTAETNIPFCSYGMDGSGSTNDSGSITNRDQREDVYGDYANIAGLAFHYDTSTMKTELYALAGYNLYTANGGPTNYAEVWEIDPGNGTVVTGPTNILTSVPEPNQNPASYASSDGFTVLTNGDFLVNDYDGDADGGSPTYREYYGFNAPAGKTPGTLVPGGLQIDLSIFGLFSGTGVTMSPDGKSLYFVTGIDTKYQTLVQTDLSGNLLGTQPIDTNSIEGIAVVQK